MTMADATLAAALKQAKSKKMFFAFVGKGTDGKLIVSRTKIPQKEIAAAKKETGSSLAVTGKCFGDGSNRMVFLVVKPPAATLAAAIKKVVHRDAGVIVVPDVQVASDADDEEETGAAPTGPATAAAVAAGAAPIAPGQAAPSEAAPARPTEPAADESARPPTEQELAVLEDRRREFKQARAAWVAVKTQAEQDLEKVKDGARMAYLSDAAQFPKIVKGCKEIDAILDTLDNQLRDTLDQYASTSLKNQTKLHSLAATATEILDRYRAYVDSNPVLKAIDTKEFADVTIHAPIKKALADLRRTLS
jgi:hypothetical protein